MISHKLSKSVISPFPKNNAQLGVIALAVFYADHKFWGSSVFQMNTFNNEGSAWALGPRLPDTEDDT